MVLTNGLIWRVYKVTFAKPIECELVLEIDFSALTSKSAKDIESLYLFAKEGWMKSVLGEYHNQKQALSRFFLGATLLTDPVLEVIRRELRRVSPDVRIDIEEIKFALASEVLKREVMEGQKADDARKKIARVSQNALRTKSNKEVKATVVVAGETVRKTAAPDMKQEEGA